VITAHINTEIITITHQKYNDLTSSDIRSNLTLYFPPSCLVKLKSKKTSSNSQKITTEMIADYLGEALVRNDKLNSNQFIKDLKTICQNSSVASLDAIIEEGLFDEVIKAQIDKEFWISFEKSLQDLTRQKTNETEFDKYLRENINLHVLSKKTDPTYIENVLAADPSILSFVRSHFKNLNDENVKKTISHKLLDGIFSSTDPNGIASEFVHYLLLSNVGNNGKKTVFEEVDESIDDLHWTEVLWFRKKVKEKGKEAVNKLWTPQKLESYLKWDRLHSAERHLIQQHFLNYAIKNSIDLGDNKKILTRKISLFLENKIRHDGQSFKDRLSQAIENDIESSM
jgi:hypothetical protein